MKDRLCGYGNCENETVKVTVNYNGERLAFCCAEHAALWLLHYGSGISISTYDRVRELYQRDFP